MKKDIQIQGWCPVGPVLPHGERMCLFSLGWQGSRSSDGVTIKMPYWVDVLLRPAPHPIFSYRVG